MYLLSHITGKMYTISSGGPEKKALAGVIRPSSRSLQILINNIIQFKKASLSNLKKNVKSRLV
jgi:hypothetical protein